MDATQRVAMAAVMAMDFMVDVFAAVVVSKVMMVTVAAMYTHFLIL